MHLVDFSVPLVINKVKQQELGAFHCLFTYFNAIQAGVRVEGVGMEV